MMRVFSFLALTIWLATGAVAQDVRIKDLADFEGFRGNDLLGYGLVVGLNGSGDSLRSSPFTEEMLSGILERLGVNVVGEQIRANNVAAVLVTGELPPFARAGSRIDVTVSAIGDADSLRGGTLVMTPLRAADGETYAVAQGSLITAGLEEEGEAERLSIGVPTAGLIPGGARVEREVDFEFGAMERFQLALRMPDATTARRVTEEINRRIGLPLARARDPGTISIEAALAPMGLNDLVAEIGELRIRPEGRARVIVDQRTGTIVVGEAVRISPVAVNKGTLTLRVAETVEIVQPNPFTAGQTIAVPHTSIREDRNETGFRLLGGETSLADVVEGLNALGVGADEMIDIIAAINLAGALHAEFEIR